MCIQVKINIEPFSQVYNFLLFATLPHRRTGTNKTPQAQRLEGRFIILDCLGCGLLDEH